MAINANNFFNLEEEARTQGTLGGKKLTKEERKEAFKKQGKVEFKTFVQKVLNKKEPMKPVALLKHWVVVQQKHYLLYYESSTR